MGDYVTLLAQFYPSFLRVFTVAMFQVKHALPVAVHTNNVDHGGGFRVQPQSICMKKGPREGPVFSF